MLSDDAAQFTDLGSGYYESRVNLNRKMRNHVRELQNLGYRVTSNQQPDHGRPHSATTAAVVPGKHVTTQRGHQRGVTFILAGCPIDDVRVPGVGIVVDAEPHRSQHPVPLKLPWRVHTVVDRGMQGIKCCTASPIRSARTGSTPALTQTRPPTR